jgi:hypothetical protein
MKKNAAEIDSQAPGSHLPALRLVRGLASVTGVQLEMNKWMTATLSI